MLVSNFRNDPVDQSGYKYKYQLNKYFFQKFVFYFIVRLENMVNKAII